MIGHLNPALIERQGLDDATVAKLVALHEEKERIFREAHARLRELEFEMQRTWGFAEDETMHTHRLVIPREYR